jgi:DNA polymerase
MSIKTDQLRQIKDEVVNLGKGELYKERIATKVLPVIGEGSHDAQIMFVGEAPGKNEAATGKPFCGAAGRVLDELLKHISLDRQSVYVTNIVKDRPPNNRDPLPAEIELYAPFLVRQIEAIQPKVIATLGRFSMMFVMEQFGLKDQLKSISQMRGKVFVAKTSFGEIKIIPLYHPAVALYQNSLKDQMKKDMLVLQHEIQK